MLEKRHTYCMKSPVSHVRSIQLGGPWRWLLPLLLVLLFLAVLLWLPWQSRQMESNERQEQLIADTLWVEQTVRFEMSRDEDALGALRGDLAAGLDPAKVPARLDQLRSSAHELAALAWLDADGRVIAATGADLGDLGALAQRARTAADMTRGTQRGRYSEPYGPRRGHAMIEYHLPLYHDGRRSGDLVAVYSLQRLLDETVPWWFAQDNAISLVDRDDHLLAQRAAAGPGRGVYTHKRALDLPGANMSLYTDSVKSAPRLLPNLLVGSVVALALGLLASLLALWRHITRRLAAEGALRQQMAFRTAMENSLVTGLRARDLEGRVTYVNPAFCQMVGLPREELVGKAPPMPYWAPEAMAEYQQRFAGVLAGHVTPQFETIFLRPDGQRLPVLIFEAPLVDSEGRHSRLDGLDPRHFRPQERRGTGAPAAGEAQRQRAPGHHGRDLVHAGARAEPAAGGHLELHHGRAEPDRARRRPRRGGRRRPAQAGAGAGQRAGAPRRPDHPQRARIRQEA